LNKPIGLKIQRVDLSVIYLSCTPVVKKKLTLTIDKDIKEQAKIAAKRRGVSISELVEHYLKTVSMETDD
jgi:hypothetical protein